MEFGCVKQRKIAFTLLLPAFLAVALGTAAFFLTRELTEGERLATAGVPPGPPPQPDIAGPWPDFRNKVLHWQSYSYSFDPGSPDPANGRDIVGDIWVKVGRDNKPVALRGTFRYTDGTFYQEYLYVDGREIIVFNRPVLPPDAPVQLPSPCRQESTLDAETFDNVVDTGEPLYVDRAKIALLGFGKVAVAPTEIPNLKPADLPVAPETIIGATRAREVWVRETPMNGGGLRVTVLELDTATGYLGVDWTYERQADGSEVTRYRGIDTAFEVVPIEAVPASIFSGETLAEGC